MNSYRMKRVEFDTPSNATPYVLPDDKYMDRKSLGICHCIMVSNPHIGFAS